MMAERAKAGDLITPREFMENVGELYSEWNGGLDSENVAPGAIGAAEVAEDALHKLLWAESETSQAITKPANSTSTGFVEIAFANTPGYANTAWPESIATLDSILEITADGTYTMATSAVGMVVQVSFALLVDDQVVTMTEGNDEDTAAGGGEINSFAICTVVPVGAGNHRIALVAMVTAEDGTNAQTVTIYERSLVVREVRR